MEIRGSNNLIGRSNAKKLQKESKSSVLLLQETKFSDWSDSEVDSLWSSNNVKWLAMNSSGSAGSLLLSWCSQALSFVFQKSSNHWIWAKGVSNLGHSFNLVNVYGPHDLAEKQVFWEEYLI